MQTSADFLPFTTPDTLQNDVFEIMRCWMEIRAYLPLQILSSNMKISELRIGLELGYLFARMVKNLT